MLVWFLIYEDVKAINVHVDIYKSLFTDRVFIEGYVFTV